MQEPVLNMLIGLPGSGKSTYANQLRFKYVVHSSDEVRERLYGDESIQHDPDKVFRILHREIKNDLSIGKSCIYDATNISYKRRMAFLQEIKNIPCRKICTLIATPYEKVLENNQNRDRKVPSYVIERMYKSFDVPGFYEGWESIDIYYTDESYKSYYGTPEDFIESYITYDQCNKHHKESLGVHCLKCSQKTIDFYNKDDVLRLAGLLHDCGKPFCKSFKDSKGNKSEDAHYYNHDRVGSYNSLFYDTNQIRRTRLYIALLIRWHMQMYFIEKDPKLEIKYFNLISLPLWEDLQILHNCDKNAH